VHRWMWACGGCESFVSVLLVLWVPVPIGSVLAWRSWCRISGYFRPFLAGGLRSRCSFFHLIWLLWNERNDSVFRNKQSSLPHMLDKVKSYSLWWLKASNVVFSFGTHNWWSNPLFCMDID